MNKSLCLFFFLKLTEFLIKRHRGKLKLEIFRVFLYSTYLLQLAFLVSRLSNCQLML